MDNSYQESERTGLEIAVIGMAGRFPGAGSVDEFWENIKNGVEAISFFTREESLADGATEERLDDPNFVNAKGVLNDVDLFDAVFFGYTPAEAELMDPQMRVFYEVVWWALEHAGYSPDNFKGRIGLVAGATNARGWESRAIFSGKTAAYGSFAADHLIDRDFLSTRMAYRLNLTGPAITMKTACSSSLVAVDLACRLLLTGQCDMALAGGTSITVPVRMGYTYEEGMIKSPDGHVRAFDARSKGVVFSDGVAVSVLKRLDEALEDGDHIMAVIKGSALNNDGDRKGAYTAPSVEGQAEVIRAALLISEVDPETIAMVETHGTGTNIGDPIEIEGLTQAFDTSKRNYCGITSTKTNVGHMDTSAGIGSFLKTVMSLYHKHIPPSLNFEKPNPKIDFANSPFYVNTELKEWKRGEFPRRAGVSSFGVGGTNVHAILEEAPEPQPSSPGRPFQLLLLSAKNNKALGQASENIRDFFRDHSDVNLPDAAYTLQVGRTAFKMRQMVVGSTVEEIIKALTPPDENTPFDTDKVFRGSARDENRPVFMFSGQGSQYLQMGLDLYNQEPGFSSEMDRCFEIFRSYAGYDLKEILYPQPAAAKAGVDPDPGNDINRTELAQPVIFMIEYALARLLMKWGIEPGAMIGHSIGEYTAACLAGVFSLEDAVKIVTLRGRLMQKMAAGSMLSVPLPEADVQPLLDGHIELAAVNAPNLCVLSGPEKEIEALAERLKKEELQVRILHTSHAFHSRSMEPMLEAFTKEVAAITLNQPQIPYISNLTGTWITNEEAGDPGYYASHLRRTVRFADGIGELVKDEHALFIEVGPGRALSTFARQHKDRKTGQQIVNLVRHPKEQVSDNAYLLEKIGRLWLAGQEIDWQVFYEQERRRRMPLPLYPFQRQRFWISHEVLTRFGGAATDAAELGTKKDFNNWFYIPSWKRSVLPVPKSAAAGDEAETLNWLFFLDDCGIGQRLAEQLQEQGHSVVSVTPGSKFSRPKEEEDRFTINPGQPEDYQILYKTLEKEGKRPHRLVHSWNLTPEDKPGWGADWQTDSLDKAFYSLLYLAQAVGQMDSSENIRLTVFANRVHEVVGGEELYPEKALLLGPVHVIPQEYSNISCSAVDLVLPQPGSREEDELLARLMREICSETRDSAVAYRNNYRLVQSFEAADFSSPVQKTPRLEEKGVYLVTGGLGGIGLVMARFLAENARARLILTGRSPLPAREEWQQWLSDHPGTDSTSRRIRSVLELESLGAEVLVFSADVTDYTRMQQVLTEAQAAFGPVNGVIHAAGLPGGGIIQVKTREIADSVILPKVRGALVLDHLLKDTPPDFIMLCSSINSVVSQLGQVDYFAANAFLDAYAFYKRAASAPGKGGKSSRPGKSVFAISINWDAWQEVGMAVAAAREFGGTPVSAAAAPQALEPAHPLLDEYTAGPGDKRKYTGRLYLDKHWPLNEHMTTDGKGLLPGTTYLEMARAAWEHYSEKVPMELTNVNFVIPMMVNPGEERQVNLTFSGAGKHFSFTVESTSSINPGLLQRHAIGEIKTLQGEEPRSHDIEALKKRCSLREFTIDEKQRQAAEKEAAGKEKQGLLVFGPRWKSTMQWARYGKEEGVVCFHLPEEYRAELEQYKLHPALLDSSTGFMFGYVSGGKAYIPFAYKRLRMYRPLPEKIIVYNRLSGDSSAKEFLRFDVVIMDEQGRECVVVDEFTMLLVSDDIQGRIRQKEHVSSPQAAEEQKTVDTSGLNEREKFLLKTGILPTEGIEAFKRILTGETPQVVVSTTNLPLRIERQKTAAVDRVKEGDSADGEAGKPKHERPEISSVFVAPGSDTEKMIAQVWEEQLGIAGVGIHDDFFELGGDSLKAITINGKIHKQAGVEIPLGEFFNKPTIKGLSDYIAANKGREEEFMSIEPAEEKEFYPLSSAQERIFVLHQLAPQSTGYNLARGIELEGEFNMEKAKSALARIGERHESMRTSFEIIDGKPVQKIHEHTDFDIEYHDITAEPGKRKDIIATFVRPFDLAKPPLARFALVKTEEAKFLMLVDMHHIISDAHSFMALFNQEFLKLYWGEELPPLEIHYKDYAQWQQSRRAAGVLADREKFWLNEFKEPLPPLNLPYDFERPKEQEFSGAWFIFHIEAPLAKPFRELLTAVDTTMFMGLLAVYNILCHKLTGREDIAVGTPVAGRNHPDLLQIMGMFVNMLVLRNFPGAGKSFVQFLGELKDRVLKALDNQDYQFEDLVKKLALDRESGQNPLFDVSFTMQTVAEKARSRAGLEEILLDISTGASKFDLGLEVMEMGDILYCKFEYRTKLFKPETIQRYAEYFKQIIETVTKNKDILLKDIQVSQDLLEPTVQAPDIEFKF